MKQTWQVLAVAMAMAMACLGACTDDDDGEAGDVTPTEDVAQDAADVPVADADAADAPEETDASTWTPADLCPPSVQVETDPPGLDAPLDVVVTVALPDDAPLPSGVEVRVYWDGDVAAEEASLGPIVLADRPAGRHHLSLELVGDDGAPLDEPCELSGSYLPLTKPCSSPADCDDGLACSSESCTAGQCSYGPVAGCCDHDLECPDGETCQGGTCSP